MIRAFLVGLIGAISIAFVSHDNETAKAVERKEKLSEYSFFKGKLSELQPVDGVTAYEVNAPLFSNYAEKIRFIKVPEGATVQYNDSIAFDFPVGTVAIKNFFYFNDFRKPNKGRKIIETRLLVHNESGWEAWPYIWNEEQTEAFYDPAGEVRQIEYIDGHGKKVVTNYAIPNSNQCKGCHIRNQEMKPIGLTARQVNNRASTSQLLAWTFLKGDFSVSLAPKLEGLDDHTASIDKRARAYLDANCGHCHSKSGPANTSGLYLDINENDPGHLGVNKSPVAAGRGAGDLQFDIVPGQPDKSILVFRMKAIDPAVAMPEIGREQVHKEGVALIEEWIRKNSFEKKQ